MVQPETWKKLEHWLKERVANETDLSIIGSGGNINKLHKMSGRKIVEPLTFSSLSAQYRSLQEYSYEERISEMGLNPDRADVIMHAAHIFLCTAKWCGVKKIHVPKIGLSDGIIKLLYYSEMQQDSFSSK